MLIGVPAETTAGETRVAVTPETAKKIIAQGHSLKVQSGAGVAASVTDAAYEAAGAQITDAAGALGAELVLKVRAPSAAELTHMKFGSALIGMLNPFDAEGLQRMAAAGLTSFDLPTGGGFRIGLTVSQFLQQTRILDLFLELAHGLFYLTILHYHGPAGKFQIAILSLLEGYLPDLH